MNIIYKYMYA